MFIAGLGNTTKEDEKMNRQCFPSSLFPLRGDISAEAGATTVIVQGLQGIPIIAPPVEPAGLDTLFYDSYNNDWYYASPWILPVGTPLQWEGYGYGSSGISWIASDTLAFGNGNDGDVSGAAAMTALVLFGSASYYGPYGDYDVDYGPSYDQFYTSIFSGATQNWDLILPPNPGTSGQVLTTNGTGVTYWATVSGGGGGGTPAGSDTQIQLNKNGAFGADPLFVWDYDQSGASAISALEIGPFSSLQQGINFQGGRFWAADYLASDPFSVSGGSYAGMFYQLETDIATLSNPSAEYTIQSTRGYFGGAATYGQVSGLDADLYYTGTGSAAVVYAISATAQCQSSGSVSDLLGISTAVTASGPTSNMQAFQAASTISGSTTASCMGMYLGVTSENAGTVLSQYYGIYIDSPQVIAGGSITNCTGVYINDQTTSGAANPFAIYVVNGESYFGGSLAIAAALLDGVGSVGTNGQVLTSTGSAVKWASVSSGSPGGSNGDIQYNNSGAFGGSAATITSGGTLTIPTTQAIVFGTDTSISRISGGLVAFGTGSVGSETGGIILNTINLGDEFYDNTDYAGANGWVLSSTGTKTLWINPATSLAVPGSTGDILYNNGGVMGAALATVTASGSITLPDTQVIKWGGAAYSGVGLSQLAADTLAVGNGSDSDVSGAMAMTALILYGESYYSAYDAFQTTILSGATQDWALVLPQTSGVNGQVLMNIGSGFTEWASLSVIGVPWSALTRATANLTLSNAAFTTTFNQTSNVAWLWQNTTAATSITTNASPLLEFGASYYTGATSALDLWTIGSALAAGTNGISILSFTHSGSSGTPYVSLTNITTPASTNLTIDVDQNGGEIIFTQQRGTTIVGNLSFGQGGGIEGMLLTVQQQGGTFSQTGNFTTQNSGTANSSGILCHLGNNLSNLTATSGNVIGLDVGTVASVTTGDSGKGFTFAPTATSSAVAIGLRVAPTINVGAGVSWTGSATMLLVNPTITATGSGAPTINLMDLQNGGVSEFRVTTAGILSAYGGFATTKGGVPSVLATSFLTAQTSAVSNHALVSSASAFAKGMWRISFVATQTTAGSAGTVLGGTTGFTITFTNANGDTVSKTTALSAPATGVGTSTSDTISGDFYGYAGASTNITYSFGYTAGSVTGGAFDIAVYAEYLG